MTLSLAKSMTALMTAFQSGGAGRANLVALGS
jgi:hypothetical protein